MGNPRDKKLKEWALEWAMELDAIAQAIDDSKDGRASHIITMVRECEDACNDLRESL